MLFIYFEQDIYLSAMFQTYLEKNNVVFHYFLSFI